MARYTGPVCSLCRTEQKKLFLKGDRCKSDKCPLNKKRGAPGKDPKARIGKRSEYALQLREKQKLKRTYCMLEKQFHLTFDDAHRMPGITGENLIKLLECRFDNVVYRMHFASSRNQARQLVSHGHFLVNGKKVNIPSYRIKPGDVIEVKEASKKVATILDALNEVLQRYSGSVIQEIIRSAVLGTELPQGVKKNVSSGLKASINFMFFSCRQRVAEFFHPTEKNKVKPDNGDIADRSYFTFQIEQPVDKTVDFAISVKASATYKISSLDGCSKEIKSSDTGLLEFKGLSPGEYRISLQNSKNL